MSQVRVRVGVRIRVIGLATHVGVLRVIDVMEISIFLPLMACK